MFLRIGVFTKYAKSSEIHVKKTYNFILRFWEELFQGTTSMSASEDLL